jgi:alginate O-acetyltransferase complex protein AlgJ
MNMEKSNRFFNIGAWRLWLPTKNSGGISLLFLLLICLPLADQVFKFVKPYELFEKRRLARKPSFDYRRPFLYPNRFRSYYNDSFSLRGHLIYLNNLFTYKIFRVSASEKVIIGKQGWLFLGEATKFANEIDYIRNLEPFTEEELRAWQTLLEERRNWLEKRGIHYIFTVAPNKSTIYPELLPDAIKKSRRPSRLDQLIDHLKKNSTFTILDLRPALWEAKQIRPAYHQTDTHWNDWGAYVAYREIIGHLKQYYDFISPRPIEYFHITQTTSRSGDLAQMLSLTDIFSEKYWQMEPKIPPPFRLVPFQNPYPGRKLVKISALACATGRLPAGLMINDSFIHQLRPFLSLEFSKIIYAWDVQLNFFPKIIEKENIKIVIDEMAERKLLNRFPENPPELRNH